MAHPRWNRGGVIEVGQTWAYREKALDRTSPIAPAEILQFGPARSQKVRVRMLGGPFEGLDLWVLRRRLVARWDIAEAWVRDEGLYDAAADASDDVDEVTHNAALIVVDGYDPHDGVSIGWGNPEHAVVRIPDLSATARALDLHVDALLREPNAFIDREGEYVAPWPVALRIAQRIAERHSAKVLSYMSKEERGLQEEAVHGRWYERRGGEPWYVPPERCVEYLHERQPVFDRVRSWCGAEAASRFDELSELRREVDRLHKLVEDAAADLERNNHKHEARRLRRELQRGSANGQ